MLNKTQIAALNAMYAIFFFAILFLFFPGTSFAQEKPNFLFLLAEDMGTQIGALGAPEVQTPVLDSLAETGVLFSQAFITCPTCSPSKASIMTSRFPHTNNLRINVHESFGPSPNFTDPQLAFNKKLAIPEQIPTLIEKLKVGGYRTGIVKKFHLSPHDKFPFDVWIESDSPSNISDFISKSGDTPWFLLVVYDMTHRPFRNPETVPSPRLDEIKLPNHFPDTEIVKKDWAEYLKVVQLIDSEVGGALKALEQSGRESETIVFFLSDHGPSYHRAKFSPYDLGLHVPLIIAGPEALIHPQEGPISELVSSVDLMPTILDYARIEIPPGLQGQSLRKILEGVPDAKGHDYIFGEVHHGAPDPDIALQERSIFDGSYRLVFRDHLNRTFMKPADNTDFELWKNPVYEETIKQRNEFPDEYQLLAERDSDQPVRALSFELYDRNTDPWETNNLYGQPEYESISKRLIKKLNEWVIETDDRYVNATVLETELQYLESATLATGDGGSSCFIITTTHRKRK